MRTAAHSKNNSKKTKNNRKGSEQRSEQIPLSTPAQPTFQLGSNYDEQFPTRTQPSLTQTSRNTYTPSQVYFVVFLLEFYLLIVCSQIRHRPF